MAALAWPLLPATVGMALYARDYGLATLFVTSATLVLLDRLLVPDEPKARARARWIGYGLLIAAAGWSNLFALLVLPAHAVLVAWRWRAAGGDGLACGPATATRWAVAAAAGVVGVLPLVVAVALQPTPINWVAPPLAEDALIIPERILGGSAYGTAEAPVGAGLLAALLLLLMVASVVRGLGSGTPAVRLAAVAGAAWWLVPLVVAFAVSWVQPIFVARYLWFVAPAVVLVLSAGVATVGGQGQRSSRMAWGAALLIAAVLLAVGAGPRAEVGQAQGDADYRSARALIVDQVQPGDVLVVDDPEFLFARSGLLAAGGGVPLPLPEALVVVPADAAGRLAPIERPVEEWLDTLAPAPRVWVLTSDRRSPGPRETLAAGRREEAVNERFGGLVVKRYDRAAEGGTESATPQG
jgi:mannosyltransferase